MSQNHSSIIHELHLLLVQEYALYLKTQTYHWNVKGVNFYSIHTELDSQYRYLQDVVDELAERMRVLGSNVKASFALFQTMQVSSDPIETYDGQRMIQDLIKDHERIIERINSCVELFESNKDFGSIDIVQGISSWHQKTLWMLRSN